MNSEVALSPLVAHLLIYLAFLDCKLFDRETVFVKCFTQVHTSKNFVRNLMKAISVAVSRGVALPSHKNHTGQVCYLL